MIFLFQTLVPHSQLVHTILSLSIRSRNIQIPKSSYGCIVSENHHPHISVTYWDSCQECSVETAFLNRRHEQEHNKTKRWALKLYYLYPLFLTMRLLAWCGYILIQNSKCSPRQEVIGKLQGHRHGIARNKPSDTKDPQISFLLKQPPCSTSSCLCIYLCCGGCRFPVSSCFFN